MAMAVSLYVCTPCLAEFVAKYLSETQQLSEATKARLLAIPIKILGVGILLATTSIVTRYTGARAAAWILRAESRLRDRVIKGVEGVGWYMGKCGGWVFRRALSEAGMWCFVLLVLLTLSLPAIFMSPAGGFHVESIDLQPAKNLARHGIYGTLTTRGFDDLTHRSTAGPGIILPNALLFKVVGVSPYVSRALHVAYVIGNLLLFYGTARKMYGAKVGIVGMYIFTPTVLMLSRGASALGPEGYTAAIFYTMAGALLWFKAIESKKYLYLILSGVLWGLAFQTKWLFLFALFALSLTCALLRFAKKGLGLRYWIVPSLVVALLTLAWTGFRIVDVGLRQEIIHLKLFWAEQMHRGIGFTVEGLSRRPWEVVRPLMTLTQTDYHRVDLWGDLQFFLIIPAVLYACLIVARSGSSDYRTLYWLSFSVIWFSWWFFFNFDLAETHLITFGQVSQLFIAKLLVDLWEYSWARRESFFVLMRQPDAAQATMGYLVRVGIVCIVLGKIFIPLAEKAGTLYTRYVTLTVPHEQMMSYIRQNTEQNAVFSGWGWSLPFYVDLDEKGDHIIKDRATYRLEQRDAVPEYFIVSPEWPLVKVTDEWPFAASDWDQKPNERRKKFVEENCTLIKSFGGPKHSWLLYRVKNDAVASRGEVGERSLPLVSKIAPLPWRWQTQERASAFAL